MGMSKESCKDDEGKLKYDLILVDMADQIEELVKVATLGAVDHGEQNWQQATNPIYYLRAAYRHLSADAKGEVIDPQYNAHHSIKAAWNLLAYTYLRSRLGVKP